MNKAKNIFVDWLKENNATEIDGLNDEPRCDQWDYYKCISAFIGDNLYTVYFMIWKGEESIDYSDQKNSYSRISIDEFIQLLR